MTDSINRDESRDRRREEALARRVGDALDQLAHREAVECPDAEVIAAYHEKSLQPDEIARWENHFATCTRCRKVLQVLAASAGAPLDEKEVARLGQLVAAARSPLEATTRTAEPARPIRLNWRRRWLAPALGIAAVLADENFGLEASQQGRDDGVKCTQPTCVIRARRQGHIHRVAARFIVRRGRLAGCIVNKGFVGSGERLKSGTIAPDVTRERKDPHP